MICVTFFFCHILALNLCDPVEVFVLDNTYYASELIVEQVLADEGRAKAIAFDEIDKAPEEKKRGITIATVKKNTVHFIFFFKSILKSSIL
jgi:hypothetical protein